MQFFVISDQRGMGLALRQPADRLGKPDVEHLAANDMTAAGTVAVVQLLVVSRRGGESGQPNDQRDQHESRQDLCAPDRDGSIYGMTHGEDWWRPADEIIVAV